MNIDKLPENFNKKELEEFLIEICEEGITLVSRKGFAWFRDNFSAAVTKAEKMLADEKELLSDCWYLTGDTYDFIDSPLKAMEAYRKSIALDPLNDSSYRELANMLERTGNYKEALINIKKALELDPENPHAHEDLHDIEESLKDNDEPLFEKDDNNWKMNEHLANREFSLVIENLKNTEDILELQTLARAYGALNEKEEYLSVWRKIASLNEDLELTYADWFYMPTEIFESAEIWQILKSLNENINSAVIVEYDSLEENYADKLSAEEKRNLVFDYNIFTCENNIEKLKKMRLKFPLWEELNEYK